MKKLICIIATLCLTFAAVTGCAKKADGSKPKDDTGNGSALTKAQYSEALGSVSSDYNEFVKNSQTVTSAALNSALVFVDADFTDVSDRPGMAMACVMMASFTKNLCDSKTFVVTEDFQDIKVIDNTRDTVYNYKIKLKLDYNETTSLITLDMLTVTEEQENYKFFLTFEIKYDFTEKSLDYFTVRGLMGTGDNATANYFRFENAQLKMLTPETGKYTAFAAQVTSDYNALMGRGWSKNMPDFSAEYLKAMYGNVR